MKQTFIESVKSGDVEEVRLALSNELLLDPRGKSFTEMLSYAEANLSNLFEENKVIFNQRKDKAIEEICKHVGFIK